MKNPFESLHPYSLVGILLFVVAMSLQECKKSDPAPTGPAGPPADTNFATQPQFDLAWQGLANSPWPMFAHDPQHTGRSPYHGPQDAKVEWLFNTSHEVYSPPAIDIDGTVYFGCLGKTFYAVLPAGSARWTQPHGGLDGAALIAQDGSIYTYSSDSSDTQGCVYCYGPAGNLNWTYVTAPTLAASTSPAISKDGQTIYIAATVLLAIRSNGTLAWSLKPDSTDYVHYSIAISPDGTMLYVPGGKALYAVDTSGSLKWKFSRTPSNAAVDNDGNVYIGAGSSAGGNGDAVYSFTQAGALRWQLGGVLSGPGDAGPVIARDGTIYITGAALYAIDYAGKLKWKYPFMLFSQCTPAIDIDGTVYLGKATARIPQDSINFYAFNANGSVKYALSLKSPDGTIPDLDSSPAISSDGKIYMGSDRPHGFHLYKVR